LYTGCELFEKFEYFDVKKNLGRRIERVGLANRSNGLAEHSQQEETFALGEESIVVLENERDRLVAEGGKGILECSVLEQQLSCILVDFRVIWLQSYLVSPTTYICTPEGLERPRFPPPRSASTSTGECSTLALCFPRG